MPAFPTPTIVVSNELDEAIIEHLIASNAPIDVWGVGTKLVTGGDDAAFTGVYKLAAMQSGASEKAVMKVSDNPEKSTNPGRKNVYRLFGECDTARLDLITLGEEKPEAGNGNHRESPLGGLPAAVTSFPSRSSPFFRRSWKRA